MRLLGLRIASTFYLFVITPAFSRADDAAQSLLTKHCVICHSGAKPKGDFDLAKLPRDFAAQGEHWQGVLDRLNDGSMPPKDKPRPTAAELKQLKAWLGDGLAAASAAKRGAEGRTVFRRLNRYEYENTLRDLFGIPIDVVAQLPEDAMSHGFDNVGEALNFSTVLLERYLEAADAALDTATASRPQPQRIKVRMEYDKTSDKFPKNWLKRDDAVVFFNSGYSPTAMREMSGKVVEPGVYKVRVSAYAYQSPDRPVTMMLRTQFFDQSKPVRFHGEYDLENNKPHVVEFETRLTRGEMIQVQPMRLGYTNNIDPATFTGPGVAVQWVEIEGPLGHDTWPPVGHKRLWGDLPLEPIKGTNKFTRGPMFTVYSKQPEADAEKLLRGFMPLAYRRPITDDDLKPVLDIVKAQLKNGSAFEEAMRVGYKRVLCSPSFLYLREKAGKLNDYALASRLSYFLWSSCPDADLLKAAGAGTLTKPDVMRAQVERMLADPKAQRFTENFCGQWLDLRQMDFTSPDRNIYPEFDEALRDAMPKESYAFFDEVLKNNQPLTAFVDSDWAMLNDRMARHYGIPGVSGAQFRKVPLPPGSHRGGVMTQAAVLKVTANGTHTSPVVRGKWVLERVLGQTVSPPPPNIPAVEPDIRGATTIREQLAKHRTVETCAGCHVKIDPPGFALENYDAIGGWREYYRSMGAGKPVNAALPDQPKQKVRYKQGLTVDASDKLPDGRPFVNLDELKRLMLADPEPIARGMAERLLTYATGAPPTAADRREIDAIVAKNKGEKHGFRSLIHTITQSPLFQSK